MTRYFRALLLTFATFLASLASPITCSTAFGQQTIQEANADTQAAQQAAGLAQASATASKNAVANAITTFPVAAQNAAWNACFANPNMPFEVLFEAYQIDTRITNKRTVASLVYQSGCQDRTKGINEYAAGFAAWNNFQFGQAQTLFCSAEIDATQACDSYAAAMELLTDAADLILELVLLNASY